ncbi:unnamed protein product [Pleuronectes platessa]|uniref:Uncharacterized protein n=1 Tax=Pleuronectes platessa TaxID=8262 RepID=A0A9N7TS22_PLEPL|nr:unnamed protein product [Pleuronectes platessa]
MADSAFKEPSWSVRQGEHDPQHRAEQASMTTHDIDEVPYVKVAPEDILKVQFPRFTTLDMRPTNTDISLAVAGLLTFFNSTAACLICAQADFSVRCLKALPADEENTSLRQTKEKEDGVCGCICQRSDGLFVKGPH